MSGTEGDSRAGTDFGRYRLRRLIGRGGMGEVYEAQDTEKDRIVALKLLPEAISHDPVFRKRLQREAHSAGRLLEPHVVPIHDYGEIDGVMYVDMRMIDGTDLRKILKNYGPMTPARAVAIVRQIASAIDAAHESGIMHRDVKPENILITRDDFAYLVDFGIANAATDEKLTELGTAVGTYAYMAPERFTNDEVTYRADIYALACVLHECLTGSQPYPADSVSMVITSHLMQPIPRPSVIRPGIPAAFDQVIARGMAKKPEERYASAGDLAVAANEALTQRDQDQAANILQRSQDATMPGYAARGHRRAEHLSDTATDATADTAAASHGAAWAAPDAAGVSVSDPGRFPCAAMEYTANRQRAPAEEHDVDPVGRRGRRVRPRTRRLRRLVGLQGRRLGHQEHADQHHDDPGDHRVQDTKDDDAVGEPELVRGQAAGRGARRLRRRRLRTGESAVHRRAGNGGLRRDQLVHRPQGRAVFALRGSGDVGPAFQGRHRGELGVGEVPRQRPRLAHCVALQRDP